MKLFKAVQGERSGYVACKTLKRAWELAHEQFCDPTDTTHLKMFWDGAIAVDFEWEDGPQPGEDPVEVAKRWQGHDRCEPDFDMNPEDTASFLAMAVRRQAEEIAALKAARDEACDIASDLGNRVPRDGWSGRLREIRAVCAPIVVTDEQFDELTDAINNPRQPNEALVKLFSLPTRRDDR